jgi:Zn-dependent peptidase ImmA (M78 family)/transcriptional regulator with XRE-family HTH domain
MATTARKERAPFNRDVLRWARERVRLSPDSAAEGAGVTPKHIEGWEDGTLVPTIKQGRKLAEVYDLPFMEFLSKERPKVKPLELVPDFRTHRDIKNPEENYELLMIQSEAEETRLNAIDLFEMLGSEPPTLPEDFYSDVSKGAEQAAVYARAFIDLKISEQTARKANDRAKFTGAFRSALERVGIIVMKNSTLASFGARGLCLFASPIPVVIFSTEAPTAQAFTLAHELGHVVLRESGISGPIKSGPVSTKIIEDWCDRFAGAFLMPKDAIVNRWPVPATPENMIDDGKISKIANTFCVSRHAALIRLVELKYVKDDFYWKVKRAQFIAQEAAFRAGGRTEYYGSRYRSARGDLYTGLVLDAWSNGAITNHNAAEFMGIKNIAHLDAIRDRFRG